MPEDVEGLYLCMAWFRAPLPGGLDTRWPQICRIILIIASSIVGRGAIPSSCREVAALSFGGPRTILCGRRVRRAVRPWEWAHRKERWSINSPSAARSLAEQFAPTDLAEDLGQQDRPGDWDPAAAGGDPGDHRRPAQARRRPGASRQDAGHRHPLLHDDDEHHRHAGGREAGQPEACSPGKSSR